MLNYALARNATAQNKNKLSRGILTQQLPQDYSYVLKKMSLL